MLPLLCNTTRGKGPEMAAKLHHTSYIVNKKYDSGLKGICGETKIANRGMQRM